MSIAISPSPWDGEFALDTTYVPRRNVVNVGAESLLLEGMRRMDEQRR